MLKLVDISKTYDNKVVALKKLNLCLEKPQLAVIIGPSGCGKTTLLRIIAGLARGDQGQIIINGEMVNDLKPSQRDISFVFQDPSLFAHMNCFHNIAYGNHGSMGKEQMRSRIEKIAKMLGITELLKRYPSSLSGGQKQRVAIARAICKPSKLILMDEPFNNLDAQLKQSLIKDIRALQKELNLMILYVTHDKKEAFELADTLIVMDQGQIVQIAKPSTVYHQPINPFVARFFGDMNFFTGELANNVLSFAGKQIQLPDKHDDGMVTFAIRPEDIEKNGPFIIRDLQRQDRGNYFLFFAKLNEHTIMIKNDSDEYFDSIALPAKKIIIWKKVLDGNS